jgi:hypothetical protein
MHPGSLFLGFSLFEFSYSSNSDPSFEYHTGEQIQGCLALSLSQTGKGSNEIAASTITLMCPQTEGIGE